MTRKEQIRLSDEMFDVHFTMDTAAELLQDLIEEYFTPTTVPKYFENRYKKIQLQLTAVSEFLHQACMQMDFITGEETPLTEGYKLNAAQLISYP